MTLLTKGITIIKKLWCGGRLAELILNSRALFVLFGFHKWNLLIPYSTKLFIHPVSFWFVLAQRCDLVIFSILLTDGKCSLPMLLYEHEMDF